MPLPHEPPDHARSPGLLVIAAPLTGREDVGALCEQLAALLEASAGDTVICDVRALAPSGRAIDALARLQLTARRAKRRIRLQRVAPDLLRLLDFAGLAEVISNEPLTRRQRQRQPEQREDPLDAEEAVDRRDPPV